METKDLEKIKEETLKDLNNNKLVKFIGILQLICILILISSPFFWIWGSGLIAYKIALSGIIGVLINGGIYLVIKRIANNEIDKLIKKHQQNME